MARGKYSGVLDGLPRLPPSDAAYQDRINARKAQLVVGIDGSAVGLAHQYRQLRERKDRIEDELSEVTFELEAISQLLVDRYEAEGTTSIRLEDGSSVTVQLEPYAAVEDREAFRLWCLENGYERSMFLAWQTTNSLTKERLLNGEPEPPGVRAMIKPKLVLRK